MRHSRILGFCLVLLLGAGALLADEGADRATRGPSTRGGRSSDGARAINVNGLSLVGNLSYNYSYNGNTGTVILTADEVRNTRAGGVSGTLQLRLWATSTAPVFGQTISAFVLGTYTLGQLNGGSSFFNVNSGLIAFTPPPPGTYYITMALMEYDGTEYVYQDFLTFTGLRTFTSSAGCSPTSTSLCLNNNRYRVTASWQTSTASGQGAAVPLTSDTGYFWFFSSNNVEMVVKVLNGCALNSRYWVFSGGLTNVYVTIVVTDTLTGAVKIYNNPINTAFLPIQDTSAFATCP